MENRITLNVAGSIATPEGAVPAGTTMETQTLIELLDEHMNIEINYMWMVPSAQASERFELAVATGEVPDIMTLGRNDFAEFTRFGMLMDLTDAFERYIHPDIRVWYRYDWMTELGLDIPQSIDDLIDMAVAFVENDMGGPNTTGIGMQSALISTWMPDARGIFQGHGAYPTAWLYRGGELINGTIQPEVRDALNTLRRMYTLGAINPEFATMNNDQLTADIIGDSVGIIIGEWWLPNWPFNSNLEYNPNADWRATTIVTPEGTPGTTIINRMNISSFRAISEDAPPEAAEAMIRMINLHWEIMYNPNALEIYGERILPENGWVYNWHRLSLSKFAIHGTGKPVPYECNLQP